MVKRYDIGGMPNGGIDVQQFHNGYWVRYEKYAGLQQKLDELYKENKLLKSQVSDLCSVRKQTDIILDVVYDIKNRVGA